MTCWTDVLFAMIVLHALCDFPLQGDYMAIAKSPKGQPIQTWTIVMSAHGLIHAGSVWLVTGSYVLGALEFSAHVVTDIYKCCGRISFSMDQFIHVACKAVWTLLWMVAIQ